MKEATISYSYINGVTMRAIFSNPAGWKFIDSNGWKKIRFWRKFFSRQNCFGASTFSVFTKGQKSTSKFWKTPETKKMRNKTFKCYLNFCYFSKKILVDMVKNLKNPTNMQFPHNQRFWTVFYVFHHVNLNFFENNKSLEHLKVLLRIFFYSGVFQNFDVEFWPLLKAEKVLAPKQFWRKKKFLQNFLFFHPFESINFQPAGFLAFKEKIGPLLHPYLYLYQFYTLQSDFRLGCGQIIYSKI